MLHQHFKTPQNGGAIRSYYLAKALLDRGHRVVLITSYTGKFRKDEILEGIEIHYLPIAYDNRFGFYARAWSFIRFMTGAARAAKEYKDFDRCYAISVPLTVGLIARWFKFRFGMKFIFEVGDLWPDAPIQMGFVRNRIFKWLLFTMEKLIYQSAESIVALSPQIQQSIQNKAPGKLIHLIPNMADCIFFQQEQKISASEEKFHVKGRFVVSYIGALGIANGLDFFLQCAAAAQEVNLPVHFILCGDGAMRESLRTQAGELNLQHLSFIDFVNREGVKEILNVTDAVFVSYKEVTILETGSPNKFFDGLAAGKLIIVNFGGWIWKELEDNKCGVFVSPQRPTDFIKKIEPFVSNKILLQQFQSASRFLGERKYSRKVLSEAFASLFS